MGRLFWKFFLMVWLAQLAASIGAGAYFWYRHQQAQSQWERDEDRPHPPPMGGPRPWPPEVRVPEWTPPPPPHRSPITVTPLITGLLASVLVAAALARHFSRPIASLRRAFDAAAAGDLGVRVYPSMADRHDELTDLGRAFDHMSERLQALMDGQRQLLHDVSHELRSPLARLQAAIDIARQQPDRSEAALQRVEKESRQMDVLVGELLTLSRLETGTGGLRIEAIDLRELLHDVVTDAGFEGRVRDVQVALRNHCPVLVEADGPLLYRAVENVVRNAVNYSPSGARVDVDMSFDDTQGTVVLLICDQGPGVRAGDLAAIFQPFFRGNQARETVGYGLGLAIARRVVEALHGTISACNRDEGGLCVEIRLPARLASVM